jgi:hypothetical protein
MKIQKGISSARSDDTKSLKGAVLDWITPRDVPLRPPLSRSTKANRGFQHPVTGALLCPAGLDWNDAQLVLMTDISSTLLIHGFRVCTKLSSGEMAVHGDQWPLLVYANQEYDPEEPWEGLFRSQLLVWVSMHFSLFLIAYQVLLCTGVQAHLYFAQFGREGGEGNKIWKCTYTWHDSSHRRFFGLCSYTGASGV